MTNSSNSSPSPELVFIHGLNNVPTCFDEMRKIFEGLGYRTRALTLPGHGENDSPVTLRNAMEEFTKMMDQIEGPYSVMAFSQGALYLELWLNQKPENPPLKQVLLAPALFIKRHHFIQGLSELLPEWFPVKSLTHRPYRRHNYLTVRYYRGLLEGLSLYQRAKTRFQVPSLILIDSQDEVVDARALKKELENLGHGKDVLLLERPYLRRKKLGSHHYLFHPSYFTPEDWTDFIRRIRNFLSAEA
jgi:pimeloyl-ACP methyl ester carboxylesterase